MKTIVVKGVGTAKVKPDFVILSMSLESLEKHYETAMNHAAHKIDQLNISLEQAGFEKGALKTTDFNVETDYSSKKDAAGNYYNVFNGYLVTHRLKLSFDFDTKVLSKALSAIAMCMYHPEISVRFTVKDSSKVSEKLLVSATENARRKAQILCAASGVKLGELVNIDYNWGEINVYSHTRYNVDRECIMAGAVTEKSIDIDPDDISASDTASFVWEIVN